jgi:hypothetical protein
MTLRVCAHALTYLDRRIAGTIEQQKLYETCTPLSARAITRRWIASIEVAHTL